MQEICRHPKMNSICRALVSEPGVIWITDIFVFTTDILLLKGYLTWPFRIVLRSGN